MKMREFGSKAARIMGKEPALIAALAAVTLAVYWKSLSNGFVFDDLVFILNNGAVHYIWNLFDVFLHGDTFGTGAVNPYYRPLTVASFLLNTVIFGKDQFAYHAVNLALHLGTCLALYAVLRRFSRPLVAVTGALLFAVHPLNVEPVAYLSARADLICGLFCLLSYLKYLGHREKGGWGSLALAVGFFTLALLAKVTALMLPAVLIAHLLVDGQLRKKWESLIPFGGASAFYLVVRTAVVGGERWYDNGIAERLATAATNFSTSLMISVFPVTHNVFPDSVLRTSFLDPDVVGSCLVVAGFIVLALLLHKACRPASVGVVWYLVMYFPASGVLALLYPTYVADRYLYLPLIGFALAFCHVAERLIGTQGWARYRREAVALTVAAVAAMSLNSALRTEVWKDELSFWKKAYQNGPVNLLVLNGLAQAYVSEGNLAQAERIYNFSITYGEQNPVTISNIGVLYAMMGRFEEGLAQAKRAQSLNPLYWAITANVGRVYQMMGDYDKALVEYRKAYEANPYSLHVREAIRVLEDMKVVSEN